MGPGENQIRSTKSVLAIVGTVLLLVGCGGDRHEATFEYSSVDFTTKSDGDPPPVLDSGEPVDYVLQSMNGRKPQILGGRLVHGDLPPPGDSKNFANYYQARLDGDCHAYGARFTVDAREGTAGQGYTTLAAWADVYEAAGPVPKTPGHITFSTTTGAWQWWVSDGGGTGSQHLKVVKTGTFSPPAFDGATVWETAVFLDPDAGIAYLTLPGDDANTGSRFVTLTDREIADALGAVGLPATTIADTVSGSDVVMVEHYANKGTAETARYPEFLSMWAYSQRPAEG
jgi:hypothetical protein